MLDFILFLVTPFVIREENEFSNGDERWTDLTCLSPFFISV